MNAWRASVRLWIVASVCWIAYWSLDYATSCRRFGAILWCPAIDPTFIVPTTYLRMAAMILGPPLVAMLLALAGLWSVRASRRYLSRK